MYSGSQLEFAKSFIAANPRTGLVTMMIGANDLFRLLDRCTGSRNPNCVANGMPDLLSTLGGNLRTIYSTLRQAGFHGDLVAVTYYSLDFSDPAPVSPSLITVINKKLAGVTWRIYGEVASGSRSSRAAQRARWRLVRRRVAHPVDADHLRRTPIARRSSIAGRRSTPRRLARSRPALSWSPSLRRCADAGARRGQGE